MDICEDTEAAVVEEKAEPDFSSALAACGLTIDDAVVVLEQSRSAIAKKSGGYRRMTPDDARTLAGIWHRIRLGDVDGLPDGCRRMSATLRLLRGVETVASLPVGRPGGN